MAFSEEEVKELYELFDRGIKNGVKGLSLITKDMVKEIEPHINDTVVAALYAKTAGIICPYGYTIAVAENAAQNGAEFVFNSEVIDIKNGDFFIVKLTKKNFTVNMLSMLQDFIQMS